MDLPSICATSIFCLTGVQVQYNISDIFYNTISATDFIVNINILGLNNVKGLKHYIFVKRTNFN